MEYPSIEQAAKTAPPVVEQKLQQEVTSYTGNIRKWKWLVLILSAFWGTVRLILISEN